jgi:sugar (pentulose or hexulose) kinase
MPNDHPPLTPHCHGNADLETLDWCDRLLANECAELERREARARATNQCTISLTLSAQIAVIHRLRDEVRHHFWVQAHAIGVS